MPVSFSNLLDSMPAVGDDELDEVGEYLVSTLENGSKQLCHSVWLYFLDILSHGQAMTVAFKDVFLPSSVRR